MRSVYLVPGLVLNLLGATFALRRAGVVALASAFVSSVMKGRALQECLRSGVVAGSLVTSPLVVVTKARALRRDK